MHLLVRDAAVLPAPEKISVKADGAERLAALYAFPPLAEGQVHVRAVMNTTVDGAIAGADGTSGSLHDPDDSFLFGVLRALSDVVLVGAGTVRVEDYRHPSGRSDLRDPSRRPAGADRPVLAIRTTTGELPDSVEADWPTLLITPPQHRETVLERTGFPAEQVIAAADEEAAISALAARGLRGIQAEGGPSALGRLAAAGLLDELCFTVSHCTVGGSSPRVLDGPAHRTSWELSSLLLGERSTITRYRRAA
ncbi:MAG TPA: dihydrofolate reductase family protein [Candidatus Brachybacterium merdigallinarum]|nr:dihydrofolate reductase family protein [Candidatus Brachybacterium merdigallinarum]